MAPKLERITRIVTPLYQRGLAYQGKNDHAAALVDFDRVLELNANYVPAYNARGQVHQRNGDFDRAIAQFTEAITRSPKFSAAYFNRSVAHKTRGELSAALLDFDRLIELSPTYPNAHLQRAAVRLAAHDFEGALTDYDQAITRARDSAHYLRLYRAIAQLQLRRENAMTDLAATVQRWPPAGRSHSATFSPAFCPQANSSHSQLRAAAQPCLPARAKGITSRA